MQDNFFINEHLIKNKSKTFIIAEVAQSHEGSLGIALSFIDAAAKAGGQARSRRSACTRGARLA